MLYCSSYFIARIAELPFETLTLFQCGRVLKIAAELDRLEAELSFGKEKLCEQLYAHLAKEPEAAARRILLDLKRCVFNGRLPAGTGRCDDIEAMLVASPTLRNEIQRWTACLRARQDLIDASPTAMELDLADVRRQLVRLWAASVLQRGIFSAQPQVQQKFHAMSTSAEQTWDRRVERTVLTYGYRMATKTSPFGALAAVGIGQLVCSPEGQGEEWETPSTASVRLSAAGMDVVARVLRLSAPDSTLRLNETARVDGEDVYFLRAASLQPDTLVFAGRAETLVAIQRNGFLDIVLKIFEEDVFLTQTSLIAQIREHAPLTISTERIAALVDQIVNSGLLYQVPCPLSGRSSVRPQLVEMESQTAPSPTNRVADTLSGMQSLISDMSAKPLAEQGRRLRLLAQSFEVISRPLAIPLPADARKLVYHSCHLGDSLKLDRQEITRIEPALRRIGSVIPLFNIEHTCQQLLLRFLRDHGVAGQVGEPLLSCYRRFHNEVLSSEAGLAVWSYLEPLAYCSSTASQDAHQTAFLDRLLEAGLRSDAARVELSENLLEEYGEAAVAFSPTRLPLSLGFLGQLWQNTPESGACDFVINEILPGYGMSFAANADNVSADLPRGWLTAELRKTRQQHTAQAGVEILDLVGIFGFDGQIHPQLTKRCIQYPEETRTQSDRSVSLHRLNVVMDEAMKCPMLIERSTGKRVVPVNAGTLSPNLVPPFFRFLMSFGPAFLPSLHLLERLESRLSAEDLNATRHYARLQHESITLLRETWCVPIDEFPLRTAIETDFSYFRRMRRWAGTAGLPDRVYVRAILNPSVLRRSAHFRRLLKPFYVAWDDYISYHHFQDYTPDAVATVIISEMLPTPEQCPFERAGKRNAVELILEMNDIE